MTMNLFDSYENAEVWYHPIADRLFIFHHASFLLMPCLEREDGIKYICKHPYDVNADIQEKREKLIFIGDL